MLLARGADPEARNNGGFSPLEVIPHRAGAEDAKKLFTNLLVISTRKYMPKIPAQAPKCLEDKKIETCKNFKVYVRYFLRGTDVSWATSTSIHRLIYNEENDGKKNELDRIEDNFRNYLDQLEHKPDDTSDVWRWVHFPANNASPPIIPSKLGASPTRANKVADDMG